jgi:hypothetical protein
MYHLHIQIFSSFDGNALVFKGTVYCALTFRYGLFRDLGHLAMGCFVMGRFVIWAVW